MIEQEIRLRSAHHGVMPMVHMVQNDTGRTLKMILEDMEVEAGMEAVLSVRRPDNSYYSIEALAIPAENAVSAVLFQALTRPGVVKCQLKLSIPGDLVSTYTFAIIVQESVDGIPVEQLGYDIYDLIDAARTISPPVLVVEDDGQGNVTLSLGVNDGV